MAHRPGAALQRRLQRQEALARAARALVGGRRVPYLAHMRILTEGREKDLLLSTETRAGEELALLHWVDAPLAAVFFEYAEGEDYELELGPRTLTGKLLEKNVVVFEGGELVELSTPERVLSRRGGEWREVPSGLPNLVPAERGKRTTEQAIEVRLDPAQRRVVELPAQRPVLVLGEAGCGKTTVALHRVAALARASKHRLKTAVIVPTEALRRLTEIWLQRLGIFEVEVWLYDRWAAHQARRVFRGLPRRESLNTPALTLRLKRDPAMRVALRELAKRRKAKVDEDEAPQGPQLKRKAFATREDLHHLFGDSALLQQVVAASQAQYPTSTIKDTTEHTKLQFREASEATYAHVDSDRIKAIDDRELDEGTPWEDARTIDSQDYAILFELDRLRAEARGQKPTSPPRYDVLVVDEAQELAPLELALIGRSLSRNGTVIVAGDAEQQVDVTAAFGGWEETMRELGAPDHERTVLQVSYRCPPEVTRLAQRVRNQTGVAPPPSPALGYARFGHECHLAAWSIEAIRQLQRARAHASIGVICRTREAAQAMARSLSRGLPVQLALDGEFDFRGALNVTAVEEVKGLEFDHVILPDAAASTYPLTDAARRALYVAVTRASRQLVVASVGAPTPLFGELG